MISKPSIEYSDKYTTFTREEIIETVANTMTDERMAHVFRVEETALALAETYGADLEKVSLAALIHDIAKQQADSEMRDVIISENLDLELLQFGNAIWHGPAGAVLARRQFDIEDEEILDAIAFHTVGAPEMNLIAQILFVADYIEPGREFDGVEKARELAKNSLDAAIRYQIKETIQKLILDENRIYPRAIETYNAWIIK